MKNLAGQNILHYKILEQVGQGGMGVVYKAEDIKLKRTAALKFLPHYISSNEEERKRFEIEAQAAASLNHPNICTIYSIEEAEDNVFIAMEYIDGKELKSLVETHGNASMHVNDIINYAIQIAEGLEAAHKKGIVHRDIKSQNIMITGEGKVKIMDFGLAKIGEGAQVTKFGSTVGTAAYMSPEQARGEEIDYRTDIWSFGVVLYEMLTGGLPFKGTYDQAVIYSILNEEPAYPSNLDWSFKVLLNKMLTKKPQDRIKDLKEIINELNDIRPGYLKKKDKSRLPSIAVLPFSDLSSAHDQEFFCEGISEEILNTFSKIQGIRVSSRTSSFQFKNKNFGIHEIGEKLKVDSILEGSVRKSGDRIRINIQLININDGFQLWSDRYDRKLEDIFELQDDIAENVVSALKGMLTLDEKEKIRHTETNIEAYELFLSGRHYFYQLDFPKAQAALEEVIKLDPAYAPAYAVLANVFSWRYEWMGHKESDLAEAEKYSKKTLEMAENLSESHIAMAFVLMLGKNYKDSETEFLTALKIDPNSYDAHYLFARMYFSKGDPSKAAEYFYKASEIRKEDFQSISLLAMVYRMLGEVDKCRKTNLEAISRAERQLELNPSDDRALSLGAIDLLNDGQRQKALEWQEKVLKLYPEKSSVLVNAACFFALAGMHSRALDLMELFVAKGFGSRSWMEHDPDFNSIKDDPRFQELLKRLK